MLVVKEAKGSILDEKEVEEEEEGEEEEEEEDEEGRERAIAASIDSSKFTTVSVVSVAGA
jgi:hypothetical protein